VESGSDPTLLHFVHLMHGALAESTRRGNHTR